MSSFTDPHPLAYESTDDFQGGRRVYRLQRLLAYDVGEKGSSLRLTVPAGTLTDLASIPRAFAWLFAPDGPYAAAAVVHDRLYREGLVSRRMADLILFEAMGVLGIPLWQRLAIYAAVRIGGWAAFRAPRPPPA